MITIIIANDAVEIDVGLLRNGCIVAGWGRSRAGGVLKGIEVVFLSPLAALAHCKYSCRETKAWAIFEERKKY